MSRRVPVTLTALAGSFPTQPDAFAALLDAAARAGIDIDLADVDVIREARAVRLAHYFRPAVVARIEAAMGEDDTVLLLRPSAATAIPGFPRDDPRLRRLGIFAGEVTEADE